jgi:hypothetical protein
MIKKKFFVVSLPRSGTTTICKMAKICGLNANHTPHSAYISRARGNEFDFFSDTPVFSPKWIEEICKIENIVPRFIYIDRSFDEIFDSWKRVSLYKNYTRMLNSAQNSTNFDLLTYNDAFDNQKLTEDNYTEIFENHKKNVFEIIKGRNKEILLYKFEDGWEPFCDFLNVQVPHEDIPILNKNKMFDKI